MARSRLFMLMLISFLVGIVLADLWWEQEFVVGLGVLCGFVYFCVRFCVRFIKNNACLQCILVIFLGILCGMLRFFVSFEGGVGHIQNYEGYVEVYGCIFEEVDVRVDKVKYIIDAKGLVVDGGYEDVNGKVLVNSARYPVYEYGDCLMVFGELVRPDVIDGFEYDKYLERYGIYTVMYRADVEKIFLDRTLGEGVDVFVFGLIYNLKSVFEEQLASIFSEPHNSFMGGLILGSRKGIPEHLMEDFNTTGLTHIIAISGYNITLVIVFVSGFFSFLERKKKVLVSSVFIVVFVVLVGASAAVVRAAIMGILGLIALWFGRQHFVSMGLLLAAFFMSLWNPKILIYDVGFQLSFLATMGLVYVSPLLERYFKFLPSCFAIRESVLMTLSAQVLALPLIIFKFGRLSLISPIANLFVLPFIPLAMLFGFGASMVSFVWEGFGVFVGFWGYLILELIIFFVKIFAQIPFASLGIEWFSWWMVGIYYFLVGKWVFR